MTISLTGNQVYLFVVVLFAIIIWPQISAISLIKSAKDKALYSLAIISEFAIIMGSRFVFPQVLSIMVEKAWLFNILDLGSFLLLLYILNRIGNIIMKKIVHEQE